MLFLRSDQIVYRFGKADFCIRRISMSIKHHTDITISHPHRIVKHFIGDFMDVH